MKTHKEIKAEFDRLASKVRSGLSDLLDLQERKYKRPLVPMKNDIEMNGIATAIAILETDPSPEGIKEAIQVLHLVPKYIRAHLIDPIFWHDFLEQHKKLS